MSAANDNLAVCTVTRSPDRRRTQHPFVAHLLRGHGHCWCASLGDAIETAAHWSARLLPCNPPVKVLLENRQ
jgi:hypothetical protein